MISLYPDPSIAIVQGLTHVAGQWLADELKRARHQSPWEALIVQVTVYVGARALMAEFGRPAVESFDVGFREGLRLTAVGATPRRTRKRPRARRRREASRALPQS